MTVGAVRDGFPRLTLLFEGLTEEIPIEVVVDTGFYGELAMPISLINALHAISVGDRPTSLADGSRRDRAVFVARAEWNGEMRPVEVIELNNVPLMGVQLMEGCSLHIDMTEGGEVVIEPD